jgi:hypothetical protein
MLRRSDRSSLGPPGRTGFFYRIRFHPQVLVFFAAVGLAFLPLREAVGAAVYWWWGPTYRQVDFVMEEAKPNDGVPIIRGHLEPGDEGAVIQATMAGSAFQVAIAPEVGFEPGRRFRVWWSPSAPIVGIGLRSTQYMPVSALPRLPGLGRVAGYLALSVLPFVGFGLVVNWLGLRTRERRGSIEFR